MDYEEIIDQLNLDIDNPEAQKEASLLKDKLSKKGFAFLLSSIILLCISFVTFITLLIIGLMSYNKTILFSIIPFITMFCSIFGIFYGVSYRALSKKIFIKK